MSKSQLSQPKLRFRGFGECLSDNKYCINLLENLVKIKKGDQINNSNLKTTGNYYYQNGGINHSGFLNKYNRNENTISISEGGESSGYVKFHINKFWSGGHLFTLDLIDTNIIDVKYLYFLLKKIESKIMSLKVGGALPNLQKKDLEKIKICYLKNVNEQQKIALFFTLLDHHIKLWERKLELCQLKLNFHVNKIFSKNKSSKDVSLKDFIVLKKMKVNDLKIDVATVSNKYGIVNQKKYFLDRNVASENINNYYIIEEKWFGYNPARINVGSIGLNNSGIKMCLSPMYIIFSSKIKEEILEYFFKSNYFNQEIKKMLVGSVRNSLKFNDLIKVKFIKEDIKTLEKKATFLKVLNDNIKNISYYIEELKNRKKYYLNNIFI